MSEAPELVLDSSALLAYLRDEPGIDVVRKALEKRTAMSAVNWAEVLSKLADLGYDPGEAAQQLRDRGVVGAALLIRPFDEEQAREVAGLRNQTRPLGLSIGDRACLALAAHLKVPVLTADQTWSKVKTRVTVHVVR